MTKSDRSLLTGEHYWDGDIACAEGGIAAGCRFFAGYPITPSTEIAERMSERLPEVGGVFIQMEDELASMNAILGASWAGRKSMTCTSGPGFSLMMENLGLGIMLETPTVLVNVQRGGPSTGLPTLVGQQDMMQARWGSHGDYEIIAISPSSPQECFDYTILAFNLSERYRVPVLVMADEVVGHMTEKVVVPPAEEVKIIDRKLTTVPPEEYLPYVPDEDLVPPMAIAGTGYRYHVTGLTHDERGYPQTSGWEAQAKLVRRLMDKIRKNADDIMHYEEYGTDDCDVLLLSYGISARIALSAMRWARNEGLKVGLLKLITVWPFPEKRVYELAKSVKSILVPEVNMGQMVREVERAVAGKSRVVSIPHAGGHVHQPDEIPRFITEALK
ncbi:MAG: 2-oxoacid:acceptor oxidoreductase subunit alpha [Candidatus Glassbacteria bacterium]